MNPRLRLAILAIWLIVVLAGISCTSQPAATPTISVTSAVAPTQPKASPPAAASPTTAASPAAPAKPTAIMVPTPTIFTAGLIVFNQYCNSCHPGGGRGIGRDIKGADPEITKKVVRTGEGAMPAFSPAQMSDDQLNAVATYVNSLR